MTHLAIELKKYNWYEKIYTSNNALSQLIETIKKINENLICQYYTNLIYFYIYLKNMIISMNLNKRRFVYDR